MSSKHVHRRDDEQACQEHLRRDDTQTFTLGGKWPVRINGVVAFLSCMIGVLLAAGIYMSVIRMDSHEITVAAQHQVYSERLTGFEIGLSELTYVAAACMNLSRKAECDKLIEMQMPESLAKKMRR